MNILHRMPFSETPSTIQVHGEAIPIRAYQIIVWVSLGIDEAFSKPLPAILDTGHSHNFPIQESQLLNWGGIDWHQCPRLGNILVNRQAVPLLRMNLWIHRNKSGARELMPKPVAIPIPDGVSVYPRSATGAPRLPLLGLRGFVRNNLRLTIQRGSTSLKSSR